MLAHNLSDGLPAGLLVQHGNNLGLAEPPFFIQQSPGSESYGFLYSQLAPGLGKRTGGGDLVSIP